MPNILLEIIGEITPDMNRQSQNKNNTQLWMWLVIGAKFNTVKSNICIGTWNVRSMTQGKLEVVKQEMARVNVYILGISKLRWTGMDECNPDYHYIYFYGEASLRRNGVAIIVNKRVWNTVLGWNLQNDRMTSADVLCIQCLFRDMQFAIFLGS